MDTANSGTSTQFRARVILALLAVLVLILPLTACDLFGDPSSQEYVQSARDYIAKGEMRSASIQLKNALQKSPEDADARFLLGQTLVRLHDYAGAEKELRRALKYGRPAADVMVPLGQALLSQGKYDAVVADIDPSKVEPGRPHSQVLALRGHALFSQGHRDEGCAMLREATQATPDLVPAQLGLARCELVAGDADAARKRLTALTNEDDGNAQAWLLMGEVESAAGKPDAAVSAFGRAIDSAPGNIRARVGRAGIYLNQQRWDEAQADAQAIIDRDADQVLGNYLMGLAYYRQRQFDEAEPYFERALNHDPPFLPAFFWAGMNSFMQQNYEQAITQLGRYVAEKPDANLPKAVIALAHAQLGEDDQTLTLLKELDKARVDDPETLATMAQAALMAGKGDQGVQFYERALRRGAARAGGDSAEAAGLDDDTASLMLIQSLLQHSRFDEALVANAYLEKRVGRDSAAPEAVRGTVELFRGDADKARTHFQAALQKDKSNVAALYGLATLAMRQGDTEAARGYYRRVLDKHPGHEPTLTALYRIAVSEGRRREFLPELQDALRKNPRSAVIASMVGETLTAEGKPQAALEATKDAFAAAPTQPGLLVVRGRAQLAMGDADAAVKSFEQVLDLRPGAVPVHLLLAQAQLTAGSADAARGTLQSVLDHQPDQPDALASLARLEAVAGNLDRARKLVGQFAKAHPESPLAALLEPHVLFLAGKYEEAIKGLGEAPAKARETPQWTMLYADANWLGGHRAESVRALEAWLEDHQGDTAAMRKVAERYIVMGRDADAERWLSDLVGREPDDVAALNNLAYLRQDNDPASARKLAARAYQLEPGQPGIQDTYGWILVRAGEVDQGLKLLQAAHSKLGSQPSVRYHYAAALAKAGHSAEAEAEISRLLAEAGDFPERDQAKRLQERLQ